IAEQRTTLSLYFSALSQLVSPEFDAYQGEAVRRCGLAGVASFSGFTQERLHVVRIPAARAHFHKRARENADHVFEEGIAHDVYGEDVGMSAVSRFNPYV